MAAQRNHTQNRYDLDAIKRDNPLVEVVERELGRASVRAGGSRGTPKWLCPFHQERTPSFSVQLARNTFKCFGCGKSGSVIDFIMLQRGIDFPEACEVLGGAVASGRKRRQLTARRPISEGTPWAGPGNAAHCPPALWQQRAMQVMEECEVTLWADTVAAEAARAYLGDRGLREDILRKYRIGFNRASQVLHGLWVEGGVVIPNLHARTGVLYSLNVRRLNGESPKYKMVKDGVNAPFALDAILGKQVAFVLEGPFDTLLVLQTLAGMGDDAKHVGAFTFGSASSRDFSPWLPYLIGPSRYLMAMDNDEAGEVSRRHWITYTRRARRWPPPSQYKDVTAYWQTPWPYGGDQALQTWIRAALQHPYNASAQA